MRNIRAFTLLLLFLAGGLNSIAAQQRVELVTVRVIMVVFAGESLFNQEFCRQLVEDMKQEIADHYIVPIEFTLLEQDRESFRQAYGRDGEDFLMKLLQESDADLLLVNDVSSERTQIIYKAFHRDGLLDVFYLPYEPAVLPSIADVSIGRYLNLIEVLDGRLYPTLKY